MGKVFIDKECCQCGAVGKVIETFGKKFCRPCWDKKPHRGGGNSGMIYKPETKWENFIDLTISKDLLLKPVQKNNALLVKWYIEHYPGSKGILGRQMNYLIYYNQEPIGIIGVNSPPINYKKFIEYFKLENLSRRDASTMFVNNNVFRVVRKPEDKNIGTKILKLFRNTIIKDYQTKYIDKLIGIVTFVEPPRTGAVYKADNWDYIGLTQGVHCSRGGSHGKWINKEFSKGVQKHIYCKNLVSEKEKKLIIESRLKQAEING